MFSLVTHSSGVGGERPRGRLSATQVDDEERQGVRDQIPELVVFQT